MFQSLLAFKLCYFTLCICFLTWALVGADFINIYIYLQLFMSY